MRQLHPVSLHEKFVASGIYRHFIAEHPVTIEYWTIHEQPDGAQIIRVDQDDREHSGRSVLIEAWRSPDGDIERVDMHGYGSQQYNDEFKNAKASYSFFEDSVHIRQIVDEQPEYHAEMSLPKGYIVLLTALSSSIKMPALFLGLGIAQAALKVGTQVDAFTPRGLFKGQIDDKRSYGEVLKFGVLYKGDENIVSADKTYYVRGYELLTSSPTFWLDKYNILIKLGAANGLPVISLTQYARRPEPKHT